VTLMSTFTDIFVNGGFVILSRSVSYAISGRDRELLTFVLTSFGGCKEIFAIIEDKCV
jgi:hypothetical protein